MFTHLQNTEGRSVFKTRSSCNYSKKCKFFYSKPIPNLHRIADLDLTVLLQSSTKANAAQEKNGSSQNSESNSGEAVKAVSPQRELGDTVNQNH